MLQNFTFRILLAKNNREIKHFTKELISQYFYKYYRELQVVHHNVENSLTRIFFCQIFI